MIDKSKHAKLMAKWSKAGPGVYQRWERLKTRMPIFLKYLPCLTGKDVIEFGCNAGIYGYEISKVAKSYTGIDQGEYYIKQAQITKKEFGMENATFLNRPAKGFLRDRQKVRATGKDVAPINAIFATFVLYHLSDKETDLIEAELLPGCDTVYIITRTKKRTPFCNYNSHKFNKPKNVARWLEEFGFKTETEMHETGKFAVIVGVRETKESKGGDDKGNGKGSAKSSDKGPRRPRSSGVKSGRVREGSSVLPPERGADVQGADGVLPQVQAGVGAEGVLQSGQRRELPAVEKSSDEGVAESKEAGAIRGDSEVAKDGEGESGPEVQESED